MSRYYLYDSKTDSLAEFARGLTPAMLAQMAGNTAKKAQSGIRGRLALGTLGVGALGYGAYRGGKAFLNRGKNKKNEPTPTTRAGRLKARIMALKARGISGANTARSRAMEGVDNVNAAVMRSGLLGNARQGSKYARKQYNRVVSGTKAQYAKLRGNKEG